jgi:prolipoprotein diacylglyceryltransferase
MQQVLFWIPFKTDWFPDGIPVYAYGAMLFAAFVACVVFCTWRARKMGLNIPAKNVQDLGILLFVAGLAGARIVYMVQEGVPWWKFFRIWEGGIVLYGALIAGAAAFILFHRYVLRKFNITLWQMGDLAAPCVCIGIALGRVGCLLNGCCWGDVAKASCPAAEFPLLSAPSREMVVDQYGLQTVTGFVPKRNSAQPDDPRTIVGKVEPDSAAAKAGLREGDKITKLRIASDWKPNGQVLILTVAKDDAAKVADAMKPFGTVIEPEPAESKDVRIKVIVDKPEQFAPAYDAARSLVLATGRFPTRLDVWQDMLGNWPRGRNSVQFAVERDGNEIELPAFTPRTIGLHPTQLYETISMVLLLALVLAFYPFRRHDGQVWVVFMIGYAIHRFFDETIRNDTVTYFDGLTLSQNISILVLIAAIGLEIFLRRTQPKRVVSV